MQTDALRSGLNRENVANALLAATDGMPVGVISDQDKIIIVQMQVRNEDGSKIKNIGNMPVWSTLNLRITPDDFKGVMTGTTSVDEIESRLTNSIPLSTVNSDIHLEWEEDYIFRRNGQRTMQAECDPNPDLDEATPGKVEADIKEAIEAIELPQGYSMSWQGEGGSSGDAAGSIIGLFPIAFLFILVIMLLLFNSWKQVLTIVFCLPFIIVGIVPALLLLGMPFTFIAILGAMGLIGENIK